ncbi:DUF4214 domain-containing protein [Achromobacter sp. GG226]|uniref:DUF4214 domain-containing protein n=1 Tax=Verticiella alkaliphila TaxID=2779529 RepID=UPI001C0CD976|nr:DUF4214 domain-containing protein [Verticiella sp. GG226]MBU4611990.1 DUF4214 domain-containing protein [Verticiella sp. GG226]
MQYDFPIRLGGMIEALKNDAGISPAMFSAINDILASVAPERDLGVGLFTPGEDGGTVVGPQDTPLDVVLVDVANAPAGTQVKVNIPDEILRSARVYNFNTDADIEVNFNTVERVIVMGNGNDLVTVGGDKNTTLDGGDGNDTLITSGGNDLIIGGHGNDSISSGAGNDTIISGIGNDTIDGGTGFDIVQAAGSIDTWSIEIKDGYIVLTSTIPAADNSITAKNVEFIQLADAAISVVATEDEATALRLYQALLGRTADREGAEYWVGDVNKDGGSTHQVAASFLASQEFQDRGELSDEAYVQMLYQHALGREAEADGLAYWVDDLENGGYNRAEVAIAIVASAEAADVIVTVQILDGLV